MARVKTSVNVKGSSGLSNHAITFSEMLFILFLGLKLADKIDWSWWWVFAPIWVPIALVGVLLVVAILEWLIEKAIERLKK